MFDNKVVLVFSLVILPMRFVYSGEILELNSAKEINVNDNYLIKLNDMEVPKDLLNASADKKTCNENSTCQNGGSCLQQMCLCLPGTSGTFCEIIDECVQRFKPLCDPNAEDTTCQYDIETQKAFCFCNIIEGRYDAASASCKVCECNLWWRKDYAAWYDCHWGINGEKKCYCTEGHAYDPSQEICKDCDCGQYSKWCEFDAKGNRVCVCEDGYKPSLIGNGCEKCDCGDHGLCYLGSPYSNGYKKCVCDPGYSYLNDTCVECSCGKHGKCVLNQNGVQSCKCEEYYSVKEGVCEFCFCGDQTSCVFEGKTKVCQCQKGFESVNGFCMDIDECKHNPCGNTRNCVNTLGSYKCVCKEGYQLRVEEIMLELCEDINECENSKICADSNSECINTPGSYKCGCKSSFASRGDVDSNIYCEKNGEWNIYGVVIVTAFIALIISAVTAIFVKRNFQNLTGRSGQHEMR